GYAGRQARPAPLRAPACVVRRTGAAWRGPGTGASYPIHWKIAVPRLGIALEAQTPLASQELVGASKRAPSYWEGAITLGGTRGSQPLAGRGYLEMTGYAQPVTLGP